MHITSDPCMQHDATTRPWQASGCGIERSRGRGCHNCRMLSPESLSERGNTAADARSPVVERQLPLGHPRLTHTSHHSRTACCRSQVSFEGVQADTWGAWHSA